MGTISELARLETEWRLGKTAFHNARAELIGISKAVESRIEAEKTKNAERIQVLEDLIEGGEASTTAEKMARLELEKLKSATYGPTEEETALANEAYETANQASWDVENLRQSFKRAFKEVKDSMSAIFEEIVNDRHDQELRDRWIANEFDHFSRLK